MRYLILLAASIAVFFPALGGDFLYWDDTTNVSNNPNLVNGDWWRFWTDSYYRLYIPVTYTVWSWLHMITGSPWIYHGLNVALHAANGALFFALVPLVVSGAGTGVAWFATLVYMFHPLQVETVAWISGGRDLLSTFFALAAVLMLWRATKLRSAVASCLVFLLSLLCKATTAPLPFALLLIPSFRAKLDRSRWGALFAWSGSAAVVLWINKAIQQVETDNMLKPLSVWQRILTVGDTFGFYVQKIFVPWPLSGDYGRIPSLVLEQRMYWTPLAALGATLAALIALKALRPRTPLFGFGFFALMLTPVSGVVTFMAQSQSSVADRYVYLAWAGPCLLFASALNKFPKIRPAAICILAVWGGLSFQRSKVWVNNETFFPDMLSYNPKSFVGHTTMGVVDFSAGRMDLAEGHFKAGHQVNPMNVSPLGNLAQVYLKQNRMREILSMVEPVYDSPGFQEFNRGNKDSVARCARIIARAHVEVGTLSEANRKLCQALALMPQDPEVRADFINFVKLMESRKLPVAPCPPPL